jgi:hypothetical protein
MSGAASRPNVGYFPGNLIWRIVFPEPQDLPASGTQKFGLHNIATVILCELWFPVIRMRLRLVAVGRTPMPEAAINEDGDRPTREDYVRSDSATLDGQGN